MSVRKTLLSLIQKHQLNHFRINDLKELCRGVIPADSAEHFGNKIYKGVWNLKQEGILEVGKHPDDPKQNTYFLTRPGKELYQSVLPESASDVESLPAQPSKKTHIESLKRKISDYSSALASASAEAQEYQELSREFPELKQCLQTKFMAAKERAVMYQGRLFAIENVLKDFD